MDVVQSPIYIIILTFLVVIYLFRLVPLTIKLVLAERRAEKDIDDWDLYQARQDEKETATAIWVRFNVQWSGAIFGAALCGITLTLSIGLLDDMLARETSVSDSYILSFSKVVLLIAYVPVTLFSSAIFAGIFGQQLRRKVKQNLRNAGL